MNTLNAIYGLSTLLVIATYLALYFYLKSSQFSKQLDESVSREMALEAELKNISQNNTVEAVEIIEVVEIPKVATYGSSLTKLKTPSLAVFDFAKLIGLKHTFTEKETIFTCEITGFTSRSIVGVVIKEQEGLWLEKTGKSNRAVYFCKPDIVEKYVEIGA